MDQQNTASERKLHIEDTRFPRRWDVFVGGNMFPLAPRGEQRTKDELVTAFKNATYDALERLLYDPAGLHSRVVSKYGLKAVADASIWQYKNMLREAADELNNADNQKRVVEFARGEKSFLREKPKIEVNPQSGNIDIERVRRHKATEAAVERRLINELSGPVGEERERTREARIRKYETQERRKLVEKLYDFYVANKRVFGIDEKKDEVYAKKASAFYEKLAKILEKKYGGKRPSWVGENYDFRGYDEDVARLFVKYNPRETVVDLIASDKEAIGWLTDLDEAAQKTKSPEYVFDLAKRYWKNPKVRRQLDHYALRYIQEVMGHDLPTAISMFREEPEKYRRKGLRYVATANAYTLNPGEYTPERVYTPDFSGKDGDWRSRYVARLVLPAISSDPEMAIKVLDLLRESIDRKSPSPSEQELIDAGLYDLSATDLVADVGIEKIVRAIASNDRAFSSLIDFAELVNDYKDGQLSADDFLKLAQTERGRKQAFEYVYKYLIESGKARNMDEAYSIYADAVKKLQNRDPIDFNSLVESGVKHYMETTYKRSRGKGEGYMTPMSIRDRLVDLYKRNPESFAKWVSYYNKVLFNNDVPDSVIVEQIEKYGAGAIASMLQEQLIKKGVTAIPRTEDDLPPAYEVKKTYKTPQDVAREKYENWKKDYERKIESGQIAGHAMPQQRIFNAMTLGSGLYYRIKTTGLDPETGSTGSYVEILTSDGWKKADDENATRIMMAHNAGMGYNVSLVRVGGDPHSGGTYVEFDGRDWDQRVLAEQVARDSDYAWRNGETINKLYERRHQNVENSPLGRLVKKRDGTISVEFSKFARSNAVRYKNPNITSPLSDGGTKKSSSGSASGGTGAQAQINVNTKTAEERMPNQIGSQSKTAVSVSAAQGLPQSSQKKKEPFGFLETGPKKDVPSPQTLAKWKQFDLETSSRREQRFRHNFYAASIANERAQAYNYYWGQVRPQYFGGGPPAPQFGSPYISNIRGSRRSTYGILGKHV